MMLIHRTMKNKYKLWPLNCFRLALKLDDDDADWVFTLSVSSGKVLPGVDALSSA